MAVKYAAKPQSCEGCPWARLDNGYAAGIGPSNAKLAVIAESCGANEAVQGIPLVGWTGGKLNEFLRNHGVTRQEVYLDNVVRCMPPSGTKKKIPKEVIAFCTERHLLPNLMHIRPNTILALGDYSLHYLTGKKSITKYRGSTLLTRRELHGDDGTPIKVVPTYHPSFLVKSNDAAVMWPFVDYDISKAIRESRSPTYVPVRENFNVEPSLEDIRAFMEMAAAAGRVSVDIETSGGSWWNTAILCIGIYANDKAISIPFLGYKGCDVWGEGDLIEVIDLISNFLENEQISKCFQNGNYDLQVLEASGFKIRGFTFDTMIAHHVIISEKGIPHDLAFIASTYTDVPFYKDDVKGEDNFALLDPQVMRVYNCRDTLVTALAETEMEKELDEYGVRSTFNQDMRMLLPMRRMQRRGILIDQTLLKQYREELDNDIGSAIATLQATFGQDFVSYTKSGRPTVTPARLRRLLFEELGLTPTGLSKKTRLPLTDFDALLTLTDQVPTAVEPVMRVLLLWKKLDKLRSTYFNEFILDDVGRLHTSLLLHITPTGRLSSRGPNLQNIPDGMAKEVFIASPGFVFIERDYSQIELRGFAEITQDTVLLSVLNYSGDDPFAGDIHTQNACDLYNKPAAEINKDERHTAKTFMYGGVIYGGTAPTIRRQIVSSLLRKKRAGDPEPKIPSVAEIERAQRNWFTKHPNVVQFQTEIEAEVRKNRRLVAPLGRARVFLGRIEDMIRAAYNFPIQSTAADVINPALIELDSLMHEDNGICMQIHDSLLLEIRESEMGKYLELSKRIMEKPVIINGREVVFPTDARVGPTWNDLEKVKE